MFYNSVGNSEHTITLGDYDEKYARRGLKWKDPSSLAYDRQCNSK